MVIRTVQDNVFNTDNKHIAFAINKEGYNDAGFAGQVSSQYWPELANCGEHEIGTVLSKTVGNITFHALVCHSLKDGWGSDQIKIIRKCFDKIDANGEVISTIAIGEGMIGRLSGANFRLIVTGMHASKQKIALYAGYTLEAVIECYNEEKKNLETKAMKNLVLSLHKSGLL